MRLRRFSLLMGVVALLGAVPATAGPAGAATCPWMNASQSPTQRATELLGAMSLQDKIQMVTGTGEFNPTSANPESASTIAANPALCIPALVLNDATN
ncbi:MAG: hypothetical protein JOZ69_06300, partial [Myxococcales bacterium]|nr:hypothetical protein [Myxococcales bacterium]